jgi:probable F420-dependent oxidoreductase
MKFWQVVSFSEPDQLVEIARAAEEAGFHGVLLADHLFFPGNLRSRYPYSADGKPAFDGSTPFPDPWTTIAAMSSVTARLQFATMVFIMPLRNPLELAKTLGTLALLSRGRVVLGAGAGWIREEYDTLGIPFETRGKRMEEMVTVMRQVWTGRMVEHRGRFFEHGPLQMSPAPGHAIPIYFGGISDVALSRAARLGQGWMGTGQTPDEAVELCARLATLRRDAGRADEPFETIVPLVVPPDPALLRQLEAQGVTSTSCYPFSYTIGPTSTLAQKRDQLLRFGDTVIAKSGDVL